MQECAVLDSPIEGQWITVPNGEALATMGPEAAGRSSDVAGHSMAVTSQNHTKELAFAPILHGPANRRRPLRILFIHDVATDVEQCLRELRRAHCKVSADVVTSSEQFVKHLESKHYDIVLSKHPLRNWRGHLPIEILRPREKHIPVIFLADTIKPEIAAELMTQGAADCVDTDHIGHLPVAIRRALNENNLREERDHSEKKLRHSEARYRALVGNLTYGMCRCSSRGKFLEVNQALVTMLGYASRDELLAADHASDILCDASKRAQLLGRSTGLTGAEPLEIDWK